MGEVSLFWEIFHRLARLGAGRIDDDACLYLLREVLRDLKRRGRISDFFTSRMSYGRDGAHVVAEISWDRGVEERDVRLSEVVARAGDGRRRGGHGLVTKHDWHLVCSVSTLSAIVGEIMEC